MWRPVVFAMILGLSGCAPRPINIEQARAKLKAAAEEVRAAFVREDYERMADLSHPALVKGLGGRGQLVARLTKEATEMKGKGLKFTEIVIAEPSEIVEGKKSIYAIVPETIKLSRPLGAKCTTHSALIAVSVDRGMTWTFVDSAGCGGDRSRVQSLLPDFPDRLPVPPVEEPKWTYWPFN
jgi:hypothetical protein